MLLLKNQQSPSDTSLGIVKKTATGWEPYTGEYKVVKPEGGIGEYLESPTGDFIRREFRTEGEFDPVYNLVKRQGAPGRLVQVDHVIPLSLGGEDTEANKQTLNVIDHDVKTKVGAVANELYFSGQISLNDARNLVTSWKGKDVTPITIDQNGRVDVNLARSVYDQWKSGKSISKKTGVIGTIKNLWGDIKEWKGEKIDKPYAESFKADPVSEFFKGVGSELALGYLPADISTKYETDKEKTTAEIAKTAGQIVGFIGSMFGMYGILGRIGKVVKAPKAIAGVLSEAEKILPRITKAGKIPVSGVTLKNVLRDTGAFTLRGQLASQEEGTSRVKRFAEDLGWGALSGVTGNTLKSYGKLAAGAYVLSALQDPDPKSAFINTAIVVGLHGATTPIRNKMVQDKATDFSKNLRLKFGVVDDIDGKSIEEASKIISKNNRKIIKTVAKEVDSPEELNAINGYINISGKQLLYGNMGEQQRLREQIADLRSVFSQRFLKNSVLNQNYHPNSKYLSEITDSFNKSKANISGKGFFDPKINPTGEMQTRGGSIKSNTITNRDIGEALDYYGKENLVGRNVFLFPRNDESMVNLMSKKGVLNPEKNIQVFMADGDRVYSMGYLPKKGESVNSVIENARLKGQSGLDDRINADDIYDLMKKNGDSLMTAEIADIGIGIKSDAPWVRVKIGENDWRASKAASSLFDKKIKYQAFDSLRNIPGKTQPVKPAEKLLPTIKRGEFSAPTRTLKTDTGKVNVSIITDIVPSGQRIPVEVTDLFNNVVKAKNNPLKASTYLVVNVDDPKIQSAVDDLLSKAVIKADGSSELSVGDIYRFYKMIDENKAFKDGYEYVYKSMIKTNASDKSINSFYNLYKDSLDDIPVFVENNKGIKKGTAQKSVNVVEETAPDVSIKKSDIIKTPKTPIGESVDVSNVEKQIPPKVKETIPDKNEIEKNIKKILSDIKNDEVIVDKKSTTKLFEKSKYPLLATEKKKNEFIKLHNVANENINNFIPSKAPIVNQKKDLMDGIEKIINKSKTLNNYEKSLLSHEISKNIDDHFSYLEKSVKTGEDLIPMKIDDDVTILTRKNFDEEGMLISPIEIEKVDDKYVIKKEKYSQNKETSRIFEDFVDEKPDKVDWGFKNYENSVATDIKKSIATSEGKLKEFYRSLLSGLDDHLKWLNRGDKTWKNLNLSGANGFLNKTYTMKPSEFEYAKAIRSKLYHKLKPIRAFEILSNNGKISESFDDFYSKRKRNMELFPDEFKIAEVDSKLMTDALRSIEKKYPEKRINILFGKYPEMNNVFDATAIIRINAKKDLEKRLINAGIKEVKKDELPMIHRYLETLDEEYLPDNIKTKLVDVEGEKIKTKKDTKTFDDGYQADSDGIMVVDRGNRSKMGKSTKYYDAPDEVYDVSTELLYGQRPGTELKDVEVSLSELLFSPLENINEMTEENVKKIAKDIVPVMAQEIRSNAKVYKKDGKWYSGGVPLLAVLLATIGLSVNALQES